MNVILNLIRWIRDEYKMWKLRRQDPYIYEDED